MASSIVLTPPLQGPVQDRNQQDVKRRAACDECRTKKLKCSGTQPACTRCSREGISCHYSPQKTMGRPKKRARSSEHPGLDLEVPSARRKSGADSNSHISDATITDLDAIQQAQDADATYDTYDMGSYASAFTLDGTFQPWLQQDSPEELATSWHSPSSNAVPALIPDNDSISSSGGSATFPAPSNLDPSLPTTITPFTASCACLSTMYLTLENLNTMKSTSALTFPAALQPLREAMSTAKTIIACEECPKSFITGLQNTQLLGALFVAIAERFSKVLETIDQEATRAESAGERKRFRLTDQNGENGTHLHLGGAGCRAAFDLTLDPGEWRSMCKKVVRAEVEGPADRAEGGFPGSDEHSQCPYFLQLVKKMEERQHRWHKMPLPEDFPKGALAMFPSREGEGHKETLCLKLVGSSRTLVGSFDWS